LTNNKKLTTTTAEKCPYSNTDSLGFKSLSELMGRRKAKFLDLQKLLLDDKEKLLS
jgi:hypothetical protein